MPPFAPRDIAKSLEANGVDGRGGGDRSLELLFWSASEVWHDREKARLEEQLPKCIQVPEGGLLL